MDIYADIGIVLIPTQSQKKMAISKKNCYQMSQVASKIESSRKGKAEE